MANNNGWYKLEANRDRPNQGRQGAAASSEPAPPPKRPEPRPNPKLQAPPVQPKPLPKPQAKPKPPVQAAPKPPLPVPPKATVPPIGAPVAPPLILPGQQMRMRQEKMALAAEPEAPRVPAQEAPWPPKASEPGPHDKGKHSQTVGEQGPVLVQDQVLHETLEDFVHSTKLGRVVHTKGFGAFGYFQATHSMREYTRAPIFQTPGKQIQAVTRFSLAVSNAGTPDTSRNVRGFSTKFYTGSGEGVYDLLCNHIPVFLVRDAIRFPDSIRAFQASPVNNLVDPDRFWGFVATAPEATHFVTWLYSDVGTVKSLRHIRASSVNTYVWVNAQGVRRYVKYHWIPAAGEQYIDAQEAVKLAGENPDIAGQDLYGAIAGGTPVEFELHVQLMDPREAQDLPYDPLDDTKVWDEQQFPLLPVGRLVLNRNPDHFDEQIEQLTFAPSNLTDGVELSFDKMLQGRSFIYSDAQRHRLGNDYHKIPVNKQAGWTPDTMPDSSNGQVVDGAVVRADIPKQDDFAQAGQRYASLSPVGQQHLVENIAADLSAVSAEIQRTVLRYLHNASPEMANGITEKMKQHTK